MSPGSQSVTIGGAASFTVTLTNTGGNYIFNATLSDALAPACNQTSGGISALGLVAPTVSITYTCSQSNVTASFTNTVVGSAIGPAGDTVTASASGAVNVSAPTPFVPPSPKQPVSAPPKAPSFATLTVSGLETVLLNAKPPILPVTLSVSKSTTVTIELLDAVGHKLTVWTERLTKGKHALKLVVPLKARKAGRHHLRITETGNTKPKDFPANFRA